MKDENRGMSEDRWLGLTRIGALGLISFFLVSWLVGAYFFVGGIFNDLDQVLDRVFGINAWTAANVRTAAADLGIYPELLAWHWLAIEIVLVVSFGVAGLFFFWQKRDWFGTYLALALVIIGTSISGPVLKSLTVVAPGIEWLFDLLSLLGFLTFASLLFLLPDGRFVPRWSRWLILLLIGYGTFLSLPLTPWNLEEGTYNGIFFLGAFALGVSGQIYRYWRISGQIQRQQTKWILTSFALFLLAAALSWFLIPNVMVNDRPPTAADLTGFIVFMTILTLTTLMFLMALAIAVMHYRLWDIDIIIRKTLVYGLLTAVLVGIYFGSVILLQSLLTAVSGQQSPIAIVISTLVIAALFQPLRGRIQGWIDRRFFRRKYDASRTLARFSERARDEVELERLLADLIQVVDETMRPAQVILWLPNPVKPILQSGLNSKDKLPGKRYRLEEKHA